MTQYNQQKHFENLVTRMRETMLKKGNDYAGTADKVDRLANFKQAAAVTGISPAKVALVLMSVKISRLTALMDGGATPENESIQDTCLDLCNYAILHDAIINEEKYN